MVDHAQSHMAVAYFAESSRSFSLYFPGLRDSFVQSIELTEVAFLYLGNVSMNSLQFSGKSRK